MNVVCDTSSLIKLAKGDAIGCLGRLFDRVLIPEAVQEECQDPRTAAALDGEDFVVSRVKDLLPIRGIARGELEVISLAVELGVTTVVTDDEKAAKKAAEAGCRPVRTTQILLLAKHAGHIRSVKAALDAMRDRGEGIEDELYAATLSQAGEYSESEGSK